MDDPDDAGPGRIVVIVPAHQEELLIGAALFTLVGWLYNVLVFHGPLGDSKEARS